jgi:hypothetical protein
MAVTAYWYTNAFLSAFNKEIDLDTDTIKVALTSNAGYTPNQDTHNYFDDVTDLGTGNGYTAGGLTLSNKSRTTALNVFTFDNTVDPQWTTGVGETLTARRAVYYEDTAGGAGTDPLISWVDFGQDESASNQGTFTIVIAGTGIATITATDAAGFP